MVAGSAILTHQITSGSSRKARFSRHWQSCGVFVNHVVLTRLFSIDDKLQVGSSMLRCGAGPGFIDVILIIAASVVDFARACWAMPNTKATRGYGNFFKHFGRLQLRLGPTVLRNRYEKPQQGRDWT